MLPAKFDYRHPPGAVERSAAFIREWFHLGAICVERGRSGHLDCTCNCIAKRVVATPTLRIHPLSTTVAADPWRGVRSPGGLQRGRPGIALFILNGGISELGYRLHANFGETSCHFPADFQDMNGFMMSPTKQCDTSDAASNREKATMKLQPVSHIGSLDADVTAISGAMTSAAGVAFSRPFDAVLAGDYSRSMPSRSIASEALRSMRGTIKVAWRRHQTRMVLCGLDAHLLGDIGITYAEAAEYEANKPFQRA